MKVKELVLAELVEVIMEKVKGEIVKEAMSKETFFALLMARTKDLEKREEYTTKFNQLNVITEYNFNIGEMDVKEFEKLDECNIYIDLNREIRKALNELTK